MEYLKKYWWVLVLFIIFFNVGYLTYKHKDNIKIILLFNQQVQRIDSVESSVKNLDERIQSLQNVVEEQIKKSEEQEKTNQKRFRKN